VCVNELGVGVYMCGVLGVGVCVCVCVSVPVYVKFF